MTRLALTALLLAALVAASAAAPELRVPAAGSPPRLRPALPELGEFSPSDAALYSSVLRPSGAQYAVIESAALGG